MWKQAKVAIGDVLAEQAMVDFEDKTRPAVLEWPTPIPLNAEIRIGEDAFFAGDCRACAGKFQIELRREKLLPEKPETPGPSLIDRIEQQVSESARQVALAEEQLPKKSKGK